MVGEGGKSRRQFAVRADASHGRRLRQVGGGLRRRGGELGRGKDHAGRGGRQAVRQGRAAKIGVDQGDDHAHGAEAEPNGEVLG